MLSIMSFRLFYSKSFKLSYSTAYEFQFLCSQISELIPLSNEENGILGTTWASRVDRPMTAEKVRKKAKVENINSPQQTPLHHSSNDSSKRSQEFNIMVHRMLESLELLMQAACNLRTCPEKPRESSSLTSLLDAIEWLDTIESVKEDV